MERKHNEIEQINLSNKKQYRVINIDLDSYSLIKEYCDKNSLKISKWITQQLLMVIKNKTNNE
jgi:hypothetical protein